MENPPIGHIIHSNQIKIWNVNRNTTDHTKGHMKIHTMKNPITVPCVPKHRSPQAT